MQNTNIFLSDEYKKYTILFKFLGWMIFINIFFKEDYYTHQAAFICSLNTVKTVILYCNITEILLQFNISGFYITIFKKYIFL